MIRVIRRETHRLLQNIHRAQGGPRPAIPGVLLRALARLLRFFMHLYQFRLPLFLVEERVRIVHPDHALSFAVVKD